MGVVQRRDWSPLTCAGQGAAAVTSALPTHIEPLSPTTEEDGAIRTLRARETAKTKEGRGDTGTSERTCSKLNEERGEWRRV
jgi:hypothetical protein